MCVSVRTEVVFSDRPGLQARRRQDVGCRKSVCSVSNVCRDPDTEQERGRADLHACHVTGMVLNQEVFHN